MSIIKSVSGQILTDSGMAYRGVLEDFKACVELRRPSRMPVFALGLEFDWRMGGLSYGESRSNVDKTVRCVVEAVSQYDYDWAIIFPDDYVEFEPLGLVMRDDEDHPAMVSEYLPMNRQTLSGLRIVDMRNAMRCPIHLEMLRKTKEAVGDTALVMGRIAAPFSALGLIYGIEELMVNMLTDPDLVLDNMRFFVDHQIAFGKAQLEAGADLLWLGDCCASSKFVRAEHFSEFAFDGAATVAEALRDLGGLLIYHTNETSIPHLRAQVQLPVSAVNVPDVRSKYSTPISITFAPNSSSSSIGVAQMAVAKSRSNCTDRWSTDCQAEPPALR